MAKRSLNYIYFLILPKKYQQSILNIRRLNIEIKTKLIICDWSSFTLHVWKVSKRNRFVTNVATVQHDRRCSVTAGSFWTDSKALVVHWTTESSILGEDPPTVLVAVREKAFEVVWGGVKKNMPCGTQERGFLLDNGNTGNAHFLKDTFFDWLN